MATKGIYFNNKWYADAEAPLALGETSATAYRGDRGKTAYDHSQLITGNPHGTTATDISFTPTDAAADTTLMSADVGTLSSKLQLVRNNLKALFGYFTSGVLKIANGGTGVSTVAGQSWTQRKVFASPKSTIAAAPSFVALTPLDIGLTATATELNYVDGVTSAIQTQLNSKASAYEQAQTGGYTGTLSDFYADLASIEGLDAAITAIVGS